MSEATEQAASGQTVRKKVRSCKISKVGGGDQGFPGGQGQGCLEVVRRPQQCLQLVTDEKKATVCRAQLRRRQRAEVWIPWEVLRASKKKAGMGRERNRREKAFQNKVLIPRALFEFITSY